MKTKHFMLLIALIAFSLFTKAQDKYEFMSISYDTHNVRICISIDGNLFLKEDVELSKKEDFNLNTNPLLKKLKEYQDKGWEVISLNTIYNKPEDPMSDKYVARSAYYTHIAYLKKKAG